MDYFFQEQRWTDTFLSLHVKKFKRIILFLLIAFSAAGTKAQSDVKFNDYVRYSQWVIDSRLGDFYGNTNDFGFTTYNRDLTVKKNVTKWKNGSTNPYIDYVPGLVAKATIEAAEYYKNFDWAKPWFKSVEWYGNKCTVPTSPDNLDAINASKMYFGIYALANSTDGAFKDKAETNTVSKATEQLGNALTALRNYNNEYKSDGTGGYAFPANTTVTLGGNSISLDGGWFHKKSYLHEMWLDGQYMGPAMLAQLIKGYSSYTQISSNDWELITKQFTIVWNMCWDDTQKLLYHAFCSEPRSKTWAAKAEIWTEAQTNTSSWRGMSAAGHSAAFWGRAEGWYFLALVDVLEQMQIAGLDSESDPNHSCYTTLKDYLDKLAAGIMAKQDATGCWYQLIAENGDYSASYYGGKTYSATSNYLESSCTAIFTAAYLKAIRLGLLDKTTYEDTAKRAYQGMIAQFMKQRTDGTVDLLGCCKSAGLGTSTVFGNDKFRDGSNAYYLLGKDVPPTSSSNSSDYYTEGKVLGAFIMAATEYERQYQSSMLLSKDLNKTYNLNSNESLTVEVLGDGTAKYQWYNANTSTAIEGATNASYIPTESGKYYCVITVTPTSAGAKIRAASTPEQYTIKTSTADVTVEGAATTYTVTFNAGSNGTCSTESLPQASAGASITLPNVTANAGYTFDGWYTAETGGTKIGGAGETYTPTDNITLYAHYTATGGETSNGVIATFKNATATTWEASEKNGFSISHVSMKSGTGYVKLASKNTITITIPSGYTVTGLNINALCTSSNTNSELTFKNGETSLGTVTISSGQSLGDYNCTLSNNVKGATTITITNSGSKEININTIQVLGYSGTPSTPTGHTITYNFNGHGENTTDNATALPNPLPKPTADGYTFVGWYTDETLTQKATPGDELTDDVTLYAKWTPITDLFTLTSITSPTVSVNSKATVAVTSDNATIKGGSAVLYNGSSQRADMITNSQINLNGSQSSYLKITLDNSLKVGDEIIINPAASSFKLSAKNSNSDAKSINDRYVIQENDAVVGQKVIYIYKETATGATSLIKDINITRDYPESDSRATFTYGSSQLTFTETPEGTYTTTLEIGASKKGETITITPSKQDGATIKKDGTTVSGNITITAPSKTGNTDIHTYTVTSKDGSSTTTYIINVKVVKEKITLKYSDSNGNTEWTWNSTTTPTQPTFVQPTVKAYIKNAEGKDELLTDASLSYTYESDVTSVATVDASSGKITIAESGNGGAKIYATLKKNENYYADPAFFNVLLEQGYSFSVNASETAPAINTSKYITRTTEGTEEKLVKMTFGGWKWEGYANADATTKTLGSYKVVRGDKTTYYTDKWNDSGEKASDIASIDGHYYSWNGVNDAVDESKAASDEKIYGSIRYGWFKSPVHDSDGKTTVSYPYTLPVRGSFMTFEPTMNGTLTIYILQNGAWNTNNNGGTYEQVGDGSITYEKGDIIPGQFRPHAFQVVNQRGLTVQEFSPNYSVSTKQKVDSRYYCMLPEDKDYNETKYNNPYNVAKWTEFADYMSTKEQKRAHDSWNSGPLGAQKIIELDNGSFLAVQKGIVKYTFHVTGNETYYFFSNFSKMGFSGANFVPDVSQPQETVSDKISTLDLSDVKAYNKITAKENGKIEGTNLKDYTYSINGEEIAPVAGVYIPQFYSIKLTRTFKKDQWTTLSLPFNLTQTEVEQIFGKGTQIIVFDKAEPTSARIYLTFFYHEIQNVLPGYPYLIRPTLVYDNSNSNSADYAPKYTITGGNLTEFTVYNKAINPHINQHEFTSGDYTAKCTPSYCTADVSGNNNSNYSMQYEKGDIFVSEGKGTVYISEGQSYGKGYRSYIDYTGTTPPSAKALSISFSGVEDGDDNGTTTDIRIAELADDVIQTLGIGGVYNLNGQKVADTTRNLPAGIYIVNGRKVVVK